MESLCDLVSLLAEDRQDVSKCTFYGYSPLSVLGETKEEEQEEEGRNPRRVRGVEA